ncbi:MULTISPECIES: Bor/Iss family lipoprotein [Pseudoalteromonas]|uniref:Lipoprotein bor n=1 Tax=Pseudoalteromonas prydzensis TaxID=182141 RepID=A0ABR9FQB4_9GAMM|nr:MULTISPECIES: hypothetical protein [Pseudoalteromonas]MBE0377452.1 hypothetical protein [Pseudoalteromonas prydzensis ACAM 620]MBE0459026.1 hypothetical protein [Pseudoalteromonas prydzensis]WKD22659.1 Bor family protein [Pseudoalteromonas sp. KG3]
MKQLTGLLAIVFIVVLAGCTNIHFDNGEYDDLAENHKSEQWHHNFAAALYEGSSAVDLSEICTDSQWQSVHSYKSFTNGLAELVVNEVGPIWYPKTVEVSCAQVPYKVQ